MRRLAASITATPAETGRKRSRTLLAGSEEGVPALSRLGIFKELWYFLREGKRWWLGPLIVVIVLLGAILVLAQGSALAPFIYALF